MKKSKINPHIEVISIIGDQAFNKLLWDHSAKANLQIPDGEKWAAIPSDIDAVISTVVPRACKGQTEQTDRQKKHGEVFTPAYICNHQLGLHDQRWYSRRDSFFKGNAHVTFSRRNWLPSPLPGLSHEMYITRTTLEYTCGEGPYTTNRHNLSSSDYEINLLDQRCGCFDRKMIVVTATTNTVDKWIRSTRRALQSTYAYDYLGDNVLLTREAIIMTVVDNFKAKFPDTAMPLPVLEEFVDIISWNVFQMDATTDTLPYNRTIPCVIKDWVTGAEVIFSDIRESLTLKKQIMKQKTLTKAWERIKEFDPENQYFILTKGGYKFFCPLDGQWWDGSNYLAVVFKHPHQLWLANMVMHYRHEHINWWNNLWCSGWGVPRYANGYKANYDAEKVRVNNQAKRQIIRKAGTFLIEHGFTVDDFTALKDTDQETIDLFIKKIAGK